MAKKQNKTSNSGIDIKGLNNQLSNERIKLIQFGKDKDFLIRFMNGMFIVKDLFSKENPVAFQANKSVPCNYTVPVHNYMDKILREREKG